MVKRLFLWLENYRFELILIAIVFLVRLPSYIEPHWYGDEEIYLAIGKNIRKGFQLYREVLDHKPPVIYWVSSLLQTLAWMKVSLAVAVAAAAIFLSRLGHYLFENKWSRRAAVFIFILVSTVPSLEGNIFNAELLFLPFIITGMLLSYKTLKLHRSTLPPFLPLLLGGACFGIAVLIKIPAVFDFFALLAFIGGAYLYKAWPRQQLIKSVIPLMIGLVIPAGFAMAIFAVQGNLGNFIQYGLLYNVKYVQDWASVTQTPFISFLAPWWIRIGIIFIAMSGIWLLPAQFLSWRSRFLLGWFWISLFGTLLSMRPYPHYFLQLLPSFSLLAGLMIGEKQKFERLLALASILSIVLLIHFLPVHLYRARDYYSNYWNYVTGQIDRLTYSQWFNAEVEGYNQITRWLNQHSQPDDSLFVWGNAPQLYSLGPVKPASRFLTDYHVRSFNGYKEVESTFLVTPPTILIDCRKEQHPFPFLAELLSDSYDLRYKNNLCDIYKKSL